MWDLLYSVSIVEVPLAVCLLPSESFPHRNGMQPSSLLEPTHFTRMTGISGSMLSVISIIRAYIHPCGCISSNGSRMWKFVRAIGTKIHENPGHCRTPADRAYGWSYRLHLVTFARPIYKAICPRTSVVGQSVSPGSGCYLRQQAYKFRRQ